MEGFTEVTKEQFLAYVGPRDIVVNSLKNSTEWKTRSGVVIGKSSQGWMIRHWEETKWFLSNGVANGNKD